MLLRSILIFGLVIFVSELTAQAGPVEPNVRVCGRTLPYQRYNELAYAIHGNASNGLNAQLFRLSGYLGIVANLGHAKQPRLEAVADFLSVLSLRGISLCVRGNLETIEKNGKRYYFLAPRYFQLSESPDDLALPSQLSGAYRQTAAPLATSLVLHAEDDDRFGKVHHFEGLPDLLRAHLKSPCPALHLMNIEPRMLSFRLARRSRLGFGAQLVTHCDDAQQDELRITIELRRETGSSKVTGYLGLERSAAGRSLLVEISN